MRCFTDVRKGLCENSAGGRRSAPGERGMNSFIMFVNLHFVSGSARSTMNAPPSLYQEISQKVFWKKK